MKKLIPLLLIALSSNAFASHARYGSQCGLTDSYGDDSWLEIGKGVSLGRASDAKLKALPTLTKQQLIVAAKLSLAEFPPSTPITGTLSAVAALREASEGEDLEVSDFKLGDETFTQVQFYPGGNPGGVIFKAGTTHAIAFIADSDVVCK